MAHSRPTDVENLGDAWRVTAAAGGFVTELITDPRVEAQYPQWRDARGTVLQKIASARSHRQDEMLRSWLDLELQATTRFVREQLRLEQWATWVAPALLDAFGTRRHNEQHPEDQWRFTLPVWILNDAPRGKAPRAGGEDIERAARWLYRATVKNPPDTIKALAEEYAAAVNRANDARSVVQNAIDQARNLLDLVAGRAVLHSSFENAGRREF